MSIALSAAKPAARVPHTRIEALWQLGAKTGAKAICVARAQPTGRATDEPLAFFPYDAADRTQFESLVAAAQDEAASLPKTDAGYPFVFMLLNEEGKEISRERIRFPGGAKAIVKSGTASPAEREAQDAVALEHDAPPDSWPSRFLPRETASLVGISRQQMRHTEAMAGLVVKLAEKVSDSGARTVEKLQDRVDALTERTFKQADAVLAAQSQNRLLEAQARREEVETEAIRATAQVLAEWIPVGLHRVARKYGIAGDAELDPMLEKMIESFAPSQIEQLQGILNPIQKGMFYDMWMKVSDRRKAKEAEQKKKAADSATIVNMATGTKPVEEKSDTSGGKP